MSKEISVLTRRARARALVTKAMEIIGSTARREDVERAIGYGRTFVERQRNFKQSGRYGVQTGEQKAAAEGFLVALKGLSSALKNLEASALHNSLPQFPMD